MFAEADDAGYSRFVGVAFEAAELRIVAVEDRDTAWREAQENFRLGVGNLGEGTEKLQMHRRYRRNQRYVRAHEPRQRRDLAGVVHADLEDGVVRACRAA